MTPSDKGVEAMTTNTDAARAATDDAAEAARTLNHATLNPNDHTVIDVYGIVAALADAQHRTVQAIEQLARILNGRAEHGVLGHDHGDDPYRFAAAADALVAPAGLASSCGDRLDDAHVALGPISDQAGTG